jgi:hypothetical protein
MPKEGALSTKPHLLTQPPWGSVLIH